MTRGSPTTSSPSLASPAWTATDLAADPHQTPDKAARVQQMFSAIARRYDLNNRLHSFGRDQAWRRRAVALCEPRPTDHVLDAACGTGDLTEAFARAGVAEALGTDFTEAMLELARAKSAAPRNQSIAPRLRYQWADATALPFEDGSFDIVSIAFGLRNVDQPVLAIREFRRVLKPGGRLVILEFSRPRHGLIRAVNAVYCDRIMPWTATLISRDRSGAYRYLPRSVQTFLSADDLARLLSTNGFGRIESHPMTFGVCTATLGKAC